MKLVGLITVLFSGGLMLYAVSDMPEWGDPDSPASSYRVSRHYLAKSYSETLVPNVVTAVLADYRGYDTLFETVVIFSAGIAVLAILGVKESVGDEISDGNEGSSGDLIIETTARLITPIIQIFALYVIAHGHHSPGGGFQGGVIFGASLILLSLARNLPAALGKTFPKSSDFIGCDRGSDLRGYWISLPLAGIEFPELLGIGEVLFTTEIEARSLSILGVEIGVGVTVATIMFVIFANLSSRGRLQGGL